jgi:hypothetical protein
MGVKKFDSIPEHARLSERPASGLVFTTPNSQYAMQEFKARSQVSYAVADCDEGSGPVYRSTSSCHVAVSSPDEKNRFFFASITVKNHVKKTNGASSKDIEQLWQSIP